MLCLSHPKDSHVFAKGIVVDFGFPLLLVYLLLFISCLLFAFFFFLSFSIFAKSSLLAQELVFELGNLFGVELFGIGLGSLLGVKSPQATRLVLVAI